MGHIYMVYGAWVVGRGPFTDENVCELVTNFQTSLEQNIVSEPTPLRINNALVHVSRGRLNQRSTFEYRAVGVPTSFELIFGHSSH